MKSEINALKSEFEKDTTDSQVTRQILSYSLLLFHSEMVPLGNLLAMLARNHLRDFHSPSRLQTPVPWSHPQLCSRPPAMAPPSCLCHFRELRRFSPTAFLSSPSVCLIYQHQRHSLSRNPLVTRKSVLLGNQILVADQLSSLLRTFSASPHSSPSQLLCVSSHNLETSST